MKIVINLGTSKASSDKLEGLIAIFKMGYAALTPEEKVKLREACETIDNGAFPQDGNVLTGMTCLARKLAATAVPLLLMAEFVDEEAPDIKRN